MRGLPINVQLVVLIVVYEAASLLEDRKVGVVPLRQQVEVISVVQLSAYFHRLSITRVEPPHRVYVGPVAFLPALSQPHLRFTKVRL